MTEPDEIGGPLDRDVDRTLLGSLLAKLPEDYIMVVDDIGRTWQRMPDLYDERNAE